MVRASAWFLCEFFWNPQRESGRKDNAQPAHNENGGRTVVLIPLTTFRSVQGRGIHVYVFGSGERCALVVAGVHGDEPSGVAVVQSLAERLSASPEEGPDGLRLALMPLANPDGLAAGTRVNASGVDLNRNFPTSDFGTGESSGQYYGGESAASEPETRAIIDVIETHRPEIIISLHAPLACVNYNGPSMEVAQQLSQLTGLPAVDDVGYPCPGSMGTYYGKERQTPLITLELPRGEVDPEHYASVILQVLNPQTQEGGTP